MKQPAKKTIAIVICCIALMSGTAFVITVQQKDRYVIGIITNLEGESPISAIDSYKAVKLAWENFQQKYPDAFDIKFLAVDNSHDPEKTNTAYDRIKDQCDVIMISTYTTAFAAVYDRVLQNFGTLHLLIGSTATDFSKKDDNIIRGNLDMELEQKSIADFLNRQPAKKVLVIRENEKNSRYTEPAVKYFSDYFTGEIIHATFSAVNLDLSPIIQKAANDDIDYAYILSGGTVREAGIITQNLKQIRPGIVIVNTPWNSGPFLLETVGRNIKGIIVSSNIKTDTNAYQEFLLKFSVKFNYEPTYPAAASYDMASILFESIRECRTKDGSVLKKHILEQAYEGASGRIQFNPYGDLSGPLYFYDLKGKEYAVQ